MGKQTMGYGELKRIWRDHQKLRLRQNQDPRLVSRDEIESILGRLDRAMPFLRQRKEWTRHIAFSRAILGWSGELSAPPEISIPPIPSHARTSYTAFGRGVGGRHNPAFWHQAHPTRQ